MHDGKVKNRSLTEGDPGKRLLQYAIPIILGNFVQQFYNIVDSVIVGRYLGKSALAAVGDCTSVTNLFVSVAVGTGLGISIVLSQIWGQKNGTLFTEALRTILLSVLVAGLVLTLAGTLLTRQILRLIRTPGDLMPQAVEYLGIWFPGFIFLVFYNVLTSVFQSMGDSGTPFFLLLISACINVGLDLLFVGRFQWGIAGAAWATVISEGISALLLITLLLIRIPEVRRGAFHFDWHILKTVFLCAVPSVIQQSFISICGMLVQVIVNGFGTTAIAAYAAEMKITGLAGVPIVNIGGAISTFSSQNIGAGRPDRVRKAVRAGMKITGVICIGIFFIIFLAAPQLIGFFIDASAGEDVIRLGSRFLYSEAPFFILLAILNVYNGVVRGAGLMAKFLECSFVNMGLRVITAAVVAHLFGIQYIQFTVAAGWIAGAWIAVKEYRRGRWETHVLV